ELLVGLLLLTIRLGEPVVFLLILAPLIDKMCFKSYLLIFAYSVSRFFFLASSINKSWIKVMASGNVILFSGSIWKKRSSKGCIYSLSDDNLIWISSGLISNLFMRLNLLSENL